MRKAYTALIYKVPSAITASAPRSKEGHRDRAPATCPTITTPRAAVPIRHGDP